MEQELQAKLKEAIAEKLFPGACIGVLLESQKLCVAAGRQTSEPNSAEITPNSVFDVASITKAIPTAMAALALVEAGKLSLDTPVCQIVPELQNAFRGEITVRHLLTQTVDFGEAHLSAQKDKTPAELLRYILTCEVLTAPGQKFWYKNNTSILLGLVVEQVVGKKLDAVGAELFFKPLQMTRTSFHPNQLAKANIVPTEIDEWRGRTVQGEVHDESAWVLQQGGMVPGSAGLFSTAPDLLAFMGMLLAGGTFAGQRYFSSETVEQMTSNQLEDIGESHGLGWELDQTWMGSARSSRTFGKTGFTGCAVLGELKRGVAVAILSNATYPHRRPKEEHWKVNREFRRGVADIVFAHAAR